MKTRFVIEMDEDVARRFAGTTVYQGSGRVTIHGDASLAWALMRARDEVARQLAVPQKVRSLGPNEAPPPYYRRTD